MQFRKIVGETVFIVLGKIKYCKLVHKLKAFVPIDSTLFSVIELNFLQLENAALPIVFIVLGSLTFVKLLAEANPFPAMDVTVYSFPSITALAGIIALSTVLSESLTLHSASPVGTNMYIDSYELELSFAKSTNDCSA